MSNEILQRSNAAVKPLANVGQCTEDIKLLGELFENGLLWHEGDVALARQLLARRREIKARWAAVSRPAPAVDIGKTVFWALSRLTTLAKADKEIFTAVACEEIAEQKPSNYELELMKQRIKSRTGKAGIYISVPELLEDLKWARQKAFWDHITLKHLDGLEQSIERAEQRLSPKPPAEPPIERKWKNRTGTVGTSERP